jgi:hypothetical protein
MAFAHDEWRWPIFNTVLLNPQKGTNIIFTDPIPGLALIGKILYKLTGFAPNYFGGWLLAAYGFQPVAGYALLRQLDLTKEAAFSGSLLFLFFPAFIFRGHFSLLGHWMLITSLITYFLVVFRGDMLSIAAGGALTFSFVLINPYLLVMAATIYVAGLCDSVRLKRAGPAIAVTFAFVTVGCILGAAVLFGFVNPTQPFKGTGGYGFGLYSMNLLSPIVPQLSSFAGGNRILDVTAGQYEGFNYLGAGILALAALAVMSARIFVVRFMRTHAFLFIATLGLAVYALSTRVYAGSWLIMDVPVDKLGPFAAFCLMFRASGRFFWPFGYLLLLTALYAVYSRWGSKRFVIIVLLGLATQVFDLRPLLSNVAADAQPSKGIIDREAWRTALQSHSSLIALPPLVCTSEENQNYALQLGVIAATLGRATNSVRLVRSDIYCAHEREALSQSLRAAVTAANPIIIVFKDFWEESRVRPELARSGLACRDGGFAFVCSRDAARASFPAHWPVLLTPSDVDR